MIQIALPFLLILVPPLYILHSSMSENIDEDSMKDRNNYLLASRVYLKSESMAHTATEIIVIFFDYLNIYE